MKKNLFYLSLLIPLSTNLNAYEKIALIQAKNQLDTIMTNGTDRLHQIRFDTLSFFLSECESDPKLLGGETISHVAALILKKDFWNAEKTNRLAEALFKLHAQHAKSTADLNQEDLKGRTPKSILEDARNESCQKGWIFDNSTSERCKYYNDALKNFEKIMSDKSKTETTAS